MAPFIHRQHGQGQAHALLVYKHENGACAGRKAVSGFRKRLSALQCRRRMHACVTRLGALLTESTHAVGYVGEACIHTCSVPRDTPSGCRYEKHCRTTQSKCSAPRETPLLPSAF